MAKNNNQPLLKNGSRGDDVKKLQQSLIDAGYDVGKTGADGIYGPNTIAAVKQYQQRNGLAVDGIAGPKTMSSLNSNGSVQPTAVSNKPVYTAAPVDGDAATTPKEEKPAQGEPAPTTGAEPPPAFNYTQSDVVTAANKALADWQNSKPGAYNSQFQDEMDYYLGKYRDRDPFSYNFNQDALYQMYKDQYMQMGQMAMMDTMGQAAAMTGGYGNSYAQTVGQQAYNQQLSQLNNIIPELYQMAYSRYNQEGQDLLNMYNIYADRDAMEFDKHQAGVDNWYKQLDYLAGQASDAYDRDYGSQWDAYTAAYNEGRDAIGDEQWQTEFDRNGQAADKEYMLGMIAEYGVEYSDEELAAAGITRAEAEALKKAYNASAGKGDDKSAEPGYDNGKLDGKQVGKLQRALGVVVDYKWGPKSSEAAGGMTADEAWEAYQRGELGKPKDQVGGLTDTRKDEIYDFVERMLTNGNLSSGFDPAKLIQGTSFLTSDEEREYALEMIRYLGTLG